MGRGDSAKDGARGERRGHAEEAQGVEELGELSFVGHSVSHYRIERELGKGGMGEVYVAQDETLDRKVALKSIRPEALLVPEIRQRFRREARALSKLDHPNVCRIFDYVDGDGLDFLVLELIEGQPLNARIKQDWSYNHALDVARQITAGLAAAHSAGIIHRDLKPANVMITPKDEAKVLDFGLARSIHETQPEMASPKGAFDFGEDSTHMDEAMFENTLTQEGSLLGTLRYMSPEQGRGRELTTASDIYSLGLLFQEMFTGKRSYSEDVRGSDLWKLVKRGETLPTEGLYAELGELIEQMKAPEVTARPTAARILERLEWLAGRTKRRVRKVGVAGLVLVGSLGVTKYVVDLGTERDEAKYQRGQADLRRGLAEELLTGLLGDLYYKLEAIGRLEVLEDTCDRAQAYFESVPKENQTKAERRLWARAFHRIGEVRFKQGNLASATEAYRQAEELCQQLREEDGLDFDFLVELGASEFYVGQAHFERGEYEEAETHWQTYLELAADMLRLRPEDRTALSEYAYAHTNMAALALARKQAPQALPLIEEAVRIWRGLAAKEPQDEELQSELADALSWLGSNQYELSSAHNDRQRALETFDEEFEVREQLKEIAPNNREYSFGRAVCLGNRGMALRGTDKSELALQAFEAELEALQELVKWDASNKYWRRDLAATEMQVAASLREVGQPDRAKQHLLRAEQIALELVEQDPTNGDWKDTLRVIQNDLH